ncbi:2-aminoethylphosphonate aminotransferase [Rhodopseudomonas palustris]|uniref:2-aminoethylphosphonate aminotransferase n=1 Tax=Rhodopseudomonas palustris TaxID=1076 RepID=UPI00142EAA4E
MLFNPGPVSVAADVRDALLCLDMNHRELIFVDVLDRVRRGLTDLLGGSDNFTCIPIVASGSGANEAVISSLEGPVLVLVAGRYSERLALICERLGLETTRENFDPLRGVEFDRIAEALGAQEHFRSLCFVHHETTTSVLAPLRDICRLARSRGVVTFVDTVSSVFAHPINVEEDDVDYITLTANKGLEGLPGLSFVVARRDLIAGSAGRSRSFYFDLHQQWSRMEGEGKPPFTHPAPLYFATARAIERLQAETVPGRISRYSDNRAYLRDRLAAVGINPYPLAPERCSNSLLLTYRPRDFDFDGIQSALAMRDIVIYTDQSTLAKDLMFFSTMGQIDRGCIDTLVEALCDVWRGSGRLVSAS